MNLTKTRDIIDNVITKFSDFGYIRYFIKDKREKISIRLNKTQINEIKKYFKSFFKINMLFHTFYYEKTGVFDVRYIPDDKWFTDIDRYFNNRKKAKILDHKSYYERMFAGVSVKHPETIVHRINGFWFDSNMNMISYQEVKNIIADENSLFIKLSSSSCGGRGVTHISNENILLEFEHAVKHKHDIVIQREIRQHSELYKVGANSVNSLRILSILNDREVLIYSSILRMGIGESKVDNTSSGGIVCGIKDDGSLKDIGWTMHGESFYYHPTTKVMFSDVKVPQFTKAKELVKTLHPMIPDFRLVSWDIAIDERETPILLEVNLCQGGLDLHQLPNGPIFGEDTEKILSEVYCVRKV